MPVCFVSARTGAGVAELLDVIVKLLPEPDRGQSAAVPAGRGRRGEPMHGRARPVAARAGARVQGHGRPLRRQARRLPRAPGHDHAATASSSSATGASPSRSATCSCCRARSTSRWHGAVPGDIVRGRPRSTRSQFDAVLHDAAEDDHIHLKPLDVPGAGARPGDRAQAARRRAAHVGDPAASWSAKTPACGSSTWRPPTRPWSTAWASCTCACCWSGCARCTASRSRRGRRASPTARRSPRRPRATTGTRSRPAAPASSARCSCASSRCRAARGFEFVDAGQGRRHPGPVHAGGREGRARRCWRRARSPATRWSTCGWWCTTASTTASTARRSPSSPPGARPSWRRCGAARPIVLEPIVNIEITAPDSRDRRHHRRPGVAARPGERHRRRGAGHRPASRARRRCRSWPDYQSRLNALTSGQGSYTHRAVALRGGAAGDAAGADGAVPAARRGMSSLRYRFDSCSAPAGRALQPLLTLENRAGGAVRPCGSRRLLLRAGDFLAAALLAGALRAGAFFAEPFSGRGAARALPKTTFSRRSSLPRGPSRPLRPAWPMAAP